MKKTALLFGLLTAILPLSAQKYGMDNAHKMPKGLNKGDVVADFTVEDQDGKTFNLAELSKDKKVIVQFYRGNWCPRCTGYYRKNKEAMTKLEKEKGAKILLITPETSEEVKEMVKDQAITFSIISDKGGKLMGIFDVKFRVTKAYSKMLQDRLNTSLKKHNNMKEDFLPVPATYIIGKDRKVEYVQFDNDYSNRADMNEVAKAL